MAPDGEKVTTAFVATASSTSWKGAAVMSTRGRSQSDNPTSQSWFTRASLRKTPSADDDDNNNQEGNISSPAGAIAHSLGVGHFTRDGRVDRFKSTIKKSRETTTPSSLNSWLLSKKQVFPSKCDQQLASSLSTAELTMTDSACSNFDLPTLADVVATPETNGAKMNTIQQQQQLVNSPNVIDEPPSKTVVVFRRRHSSFLRVADLALIESQLLESFDSNDNNNKDDTDPNAPNFVYPAIDPPPGITWDPSERWVALDDGAGSHAPIAPMAIAALAKFGLELCLKRESIWSPDSKTAKVIKSVSRTASSAWQTAWQHGQPIVQLPPVGSNEEKEVLVWSANGLTNGGYGSDIPAVRVMGILNLSPRALTEWLIDSSRVQQYNKMSLGRSDILVLHDDLDCDGPFGKSVTKVMKSLSRPPLLRKTLQFISLLHARALEEGHWKGGYVIVTRAVTPAAEEERDNVAATATSSSDDLLQSEILTGVNVMLPVQDDPQRCLMINISHVKSPMVPMMLAKRVGMTAAANFIQDLRTAAAVVSQQANL